MIVVWCQNDHVMPHVGCSQPKSGPRAGSSVLMTFTDLFSCLRGSSSTEACVEDMINWRNSPPTNSPDERGQTGGFSITLPD
jgi:hypothetical protein